MNTPHICINLGGRDTILEGIDLLNAILDARPNPGNKNTPEETAPKPEPKLTPQQKAARTRARNKAEAAAKAAAAVESAARAYETNSPQEEEEALDRALDEEDGFELTEPTLEEVMSAAKAIHARLAIAGKADQVVSVLSSFGATRVSELNPNSYKSFLDALAALETSEGVFSA